MQTPFFGVAHNIRAEDGYTTLYQILSLVMPALQDIRPKWGPNLTKDITMYRFVNTMQQYTDQKATFMRQYTELEIVTNIIQHALKDDQYEMAAHTTKSTIENRMAQCPEDMTNNLIPGLTMQHIAHALEPSHRVLQHKFEDTPTFHKFESKHAIDPKKQVQCLSCQAWGDSDGLCYMMCMMVHIQQWIKIVLKKQRNKVRHSQHQTANT
jgi:hypothetical protein